MKPKDLDKIPDMELAFAVELAMKRWPEIVLEHEDAKHVKEPSALLAMASYLSLDVIHGLPAGTCLLFGRGALPDYYAKFMCEFIIHSDLLEVPDEWPATQVQMKEAWESLKEDYVSRLQ